MYINIHLWCAQIALLHVFICVCYWLLAVQCAIVNVCIVVMFVCAYLVYLRMYTCPWLHVTVSLQDPSGIKFMSYRLKVSTARWNKCRWFVSFYSKVNWSQNLLQYIRQVCTVLHLSGYSIYGIILHIPGEMYTNAADSAMTAMKGRVANKYYSLAEEAWAQVEEWSTDLDLDAYCTVWKEQCGVCIKYS